MERLRVKGNWSTDPNLESGLPGILTFSPADGLTLTLDGAFTQEHPGPDVYEAIYGITDQAKWGRFVKLVRCLRTKSTIVLSGSPSEELTPGLAFFGSEPFDESEIQAVGATLRLEHLDEWSAAGRGLVLDVAPHGRAFTLRYEPPPPIQCAADGGNLELRFGPRWRRARTLFRVQERATFEWELSATVPMEELLRLHVRPIQDFLTFAVDRPTAITQLSISLPGHDAPPRVAVFYKPTYAAANTRESVVPERMLFHLKDVESSFDQLLREWLDLHRSLNAFFGAFLGLVYAPPKFAEIRFDWTLHCVALLFASSHEPADSSSPLSFEDSVKWLMESVPELETTVMSEGRDAFAARVRAARNRVHHGIGVEGVELHWLTEGLRWLIKAFLLTRLTAIAPLARGLLERRAELAYVARELQHIISTSDQHGAQ